MLLPPGSWIFGAFGAGLVGLMGVGCAAQQQPEPEPPPAHLSADEHLREADRHREAARQARRDESAPSSPQEEYDCGDTVLADQSTSGTERLHAQAPCWRASGTPAQTAEEEEKIAAKHRSAAQSLLAAERRACAPLSEAQRRDSPFDHGDDILEVKAIEEGKTTWGARVVFRRVRNLDARWLKTAVECQQARAAVTGWDPKFLGRSPAALPDTKIDVTESAEGIAVTIRARDEQTAAEVRGRAEALVAK